MRKVPIVILFLILGCSIGYSQTPGDMVTDRPDQTESPDVLSPGYVQVESGVNYERYSDDGIGPTVYEQNRTYLSSLIRIGVFKNLELRIAPEYAIVNHRSRYELDPNWNETEYYGFTPLVLGTKIKITDETENMPALSFMFHVDLPEVAGNNFKSKYPTPEVRVAFGKELSDRFSLGVNVGAEFDMADRLTNGIYTLALGANIINKLSGFFEFYGFFRKFEDIHFFDAGLTYLIQKKIQLDVSGGIGLTDYTHDFFIGGGLSVRLPR